MGPQISAVVVDEMTIDVSTEEPDPILPARLYFAPLPNMVQVEERPDSLPNEPTGTGPYQFVEWVRGDHISLTAYPEWWGNSDPEAAFGQQSIKARGDSVECKICEALFSVLKPVTDELKRIFTKPRFGGHTKSELIGGNLQKRASFISNCRILTLACRRVERRFSE